MLLRYLMALKMTYAFYAVVSMIVFSLFLVALLRILKTVRNIRLGVWWTRFPVIGYLTNQLRSYWLFCSPFPPPPPQCIKWERRMEVTCFSESHMNVSTVAMYGFWLWRKTLHFSIDCLQFYMLHGILRVVIMWVVKQISSETVWPGFTSCLLHLPAPSSGI